MTLKVHSGVHKLGVAVHVTSVALEPGAKMDEAEKYKQRLEAIAEKRRLVEEQERAKREMEDERIRLQQLKRKSLRDQWLMEGPPLSPSSLEAPRSPLWGTQAQDSDKRIDELESESQQLAEAEEKLREEMEDGQIQEIMMDEETPKEMTPDIVHNGKNAAELGEEIMPESPQLAEVILTNGAKGDTSHVASVDAPPAINGQTEEAKSVRVVDLDDNVADDEEEDGTMVIRAECIMIVDEGDEFAEELTKENGFPENIEEETQETVTEYAQSQGTVATDVEAGLAESDLTLKNVEEEEFEDADATAPQIQPQTEEEGAVVASVPVYAESQPCVMTTPQEEVENEVTNADETIEVASKAKANVTVEFQEVPLSESRDRKPPGEQEPLLSHQVKGKDVEPAAPHHQTQTPNRADQKENKRPKKKTCQCCSVM